MSVSKNPQNKQLNGAEDRETHQLLLIKEVPDSLVAFRKELIKPEHTDIFLTAMGAPTFELAIAAVAAKLDIVLDGDYDVGPLCAILTTALEQKGKGQALRFEGIPGLVDNVEIVERENGINLEKGPVS